MKTWGWLRGLALVVVAAWVLALVPGASRAGAAGGVIAYGDVVSGKINHTNYFELWEFNGSKGDRIQITMIGDGQLDTYLGLVDKASEQVLAEDDDSAGGMNAAITLSLPFSGTFIIVATRYNFDAGTSQGAYTLELLGGGGPQTTLASQETSQDAAQPEEIEPGVFYMGELVQLEVTPGTIANDSFAHIYGLELAKGTEIIAVMVADDSPLDTYLILLTEAGDVLAEDDDSGADFGGGLTDSALNLVIPQTGVYYLVATRAGLENGTTTGAYVILAGSPEDEAAPQETGQDTPAGVESFGEIALDSPAQGTISANSFVHLYEFSGSAGQTVTITMRGASGLDAYLGIIDASDNVIAEDNDSGGGAGGMDAQVTLRLPESGWYLIVATRAGLDEGTTTGSYTLEVTSGAPSTGSSGPSGFSGLPGRSFEVGDVSFSLSGFGASDNPAKATPVEGFLGGDNLPGR